MLDNVLASHFVFSVYLPYYQLRITSYDDFFFSEDTDVARSIPVMIASYSVSLLDAGKSNCMACYTISLVKALSCKLTLAPVCREALSTLRIH